MEYIAKLQKHIFEITVASSLLVGFALAYLFSVILSFALNEALSGTGAAPSPQPSQRRGESTFRSLEEFQGLLAGNFLRDRSMSMADAALSEDQSAASLGEIQLYGVVAGSPSFASAAIQIVGEKDVNEYQTGQTVAGYKILKIKWDSISIQRGGNKFSLKIGDKTGAVSAAQGPVQPGQSIPGAQKITISRDRLITISNDQTELYKNKFAPITRDGKILGFKLLFVPNENFLYQLGARSGDIIRRFNGQPLESAEKMFEMWQNLKNADRVSIEVERGGKIVPFEIQIQN